MERPHRASGGEGVHAHPRGRCRRFVRVHRRRAQGVGGEEQLHRHGAQQKSDANAAQLQMLSDELRAHNNLGDRNTSLSGYGPNINLVKDPRYGRNSELPGEDPFLSGSYATAYLRGMQQRSARGGDSRRRGRRIILPRSRRRGTPRGLHPRPTQRSMPP